jgi:hypothetical protein
MVGGVTVISACVFHLCDRGLIPAGMDLLGGAPRAALARGGAVFHDKAKNIRDKTRYGNLSNNMMISEL